MSSPGAIHLWLDKLQHPSAIDQREFQGKAQKIHVR
jgi:hypothetical protein